MMIDIHAHAAGDYGSVDSIKSTAAKYGIEKIVLCTSPKNNPDLQAPPRMPLIQKPDSIFMMNRMNRFAYRHFIQDNGDGNQFVCKLTNRLPELAVQFLWVDPLNTAYMDNLENTIETYRPRGIKLHQAWNPFKLDGTEFRNLMDIASSHQLPVFIHLYSKREVRKLIRFIKENPKAVLIIGHLAGADLFSGSGVDLANVYFDTSSSGRIQSRDIRQAIDAFGYEHIVFGTDTPYAGIEEQIGRIERLKLPDRIKDHIYCLNAKRILSL
jgi:Predicted metal-dependent hydrolase of the TIM-barrel fold